MILARCLVICWVLCLASWAQSNVPRTTELDTAKLIGAEHDVAELRDLLAKGNSDRWRILWLHQRIMERVMATSLQVDATIAQIDNEIARANEVHGFLADKRDRRVTRANLISVIIGGGLGATSSGLQLSSTLNKPAAAVGIAAGTASAGFAIAGIHAQAGGTEVFDFSSNMLAEFFDRPLLPNSHYPETVWTFLNGIPPQQGNGATRTQQLVQEWVRLKRIDSLESKEKIDHLSSEPSQELRLTIDDYEDRAAMLQDVRARVSFLKRDLGALLGSLPVVDE